MPAGRKIKLNKRIQDDICKYLKEGQCHYVAVNLAGISQSAYYDWLAKGEQAAIKDENGEKLTKKFAGYLDNFQLILDALAKNEVD